MKAKIFFLISVLLFINNHAAAERWILKNPRQALLKNSADHRVVSHLSLDKVHYAIIETTKSASAFKQQVQLQGLAESVVPDLKIELPELKANPFSRLAWHVERMQYAQIPKNKTYQSVVVAVLDTGVDYNHDALKNHMWMNSKEIAGNLIDDDNNGYVDDIYGYDFDSKDSNPMDDHSHGTHCAGIVAADADVSTGAQGVATNAKVMAVRIIGGDSSGFLSNAAIGIKYATDNGAQVLSNSWRVYKDWTSFNTTEENLALLKSAIQYAEDRGVIFVAAAGNESTNNDLLPKEEQIFPVGYNGLSHLVGVAATTVSDTMAYWSNYGPISTTVAAPGDNIMSTVPSNGWSSKSGTSMATPLVSGVIAMGLGMGLNSNQAIDSLVTTSDAMPNFSSKVKSGGIINILKYLQ